MKNKHLLFILVIILTSCSSQENKVDPTVNEVFFEKNNLDLGTISNNKVQPIKISIINPLNTKIKIVDISKSCGCMDFKIKEPVIQSKSKQSFVINYNPKDDLGKINRSVVLRLSNDNFLVFKFKGIVVNKKES